MGRYLKKAKFHAERIQYYYDYAGPMGYSQAKSHWHDLCDLIGRALRSKHDKNDAIVIGSIKESVQPLMEHMKKREEDDTKPREKTDGQQPD